MMMMLMRRILLDFGSSFHFVSYSLVSLYHSRRVVPCRVVAVGKGNTIRYETGNDTGNGN